MVKYLCAAVETYRLESRDDVEKFHKKLLADGVEQGYAISGYAYTEKPIKDSGEVVDSYFVVKVTKSFDDPKDPITSPLDTIEYKKYDVPSEHVLIKKESDDEEAMPW